MSGIVLSAWSGVLSRQNFYSQSIIFQKKKDISNWDFGKQAVSLDADWISEGEGSGDYLATLQRVITRSGLHWIDHMFLR